MRLTRNILAEDIMRRIELVGTSKEGRYDIREVKRMIDYVTTSLIKLQFYESRADFELQHNDSHWLATFDAIQVSRDDTRPFQKVYFDLPADYVSLPKNMGVHSITDAQTGEEMVPVPYGFSAMNKGRRILATELRWSYEVHRFRVFLNERLDGVDFVESKAEGDTFPPVFVNLKLVIVSPADTIDDQPYPLAPDMVPVLTDRVVQMMLTGYQLPEAKPPKV